jgi:hypothetical protein
VNNELQPMDEDIPESIPGSGHLPGLPSQRKLIKNQMARSGFRSDARRPEEIVHTPTIMGNQYDLPGRFGALNESRLLRITVEEKKAFTNIAIKQLAAHCIRIIGVYEDQNPDAQGLWIEVEYEAANESLRTIFDRIERFTREQPGGGSPWDEIAQYTGIGDRDIRALQTYLSLHIKATVRAGYAVNGKGTSKLGWSDDFAGYARPGYTRSGLKALCPSNAAQPWTAAGELGAQRRVMMDLLRESPRALMVCGFATAGVLMRPLGISENYLLAMVGPESSSLGKTTLVLAIKSMCGAPDNLKTFDSTSKALRASAIDGNDSTVLIDEVGAAGRTDPKEQDALVYGLAAGVARDRLIRKNGEYVPAKETSPSRYTAIITGERSLINKESARKGILIRYSEIEVSPQRRLWNFTDSARIERAMNDLRQNHGHIYPELIDLLIAHPENRRAIEAYYSEELEIVRERCGNEKQKRKARLVALASSGLIALRMVLDPHGVEENAWASALNAANELLDDYIDNETASETNSSIASLPLALAQHLAVATGTTAKLPSRVLAGSMWPRQTRYKAKRFGDVESISSEGPGEEIKGTVISLNAKLAGPLIREKLGIDLDALVREAVRHGLVKLNVGNNGGWRSTSMTRFIIAEDGSTARSRGIEMIIPDAWEPPETDTAPRADYDDSDLIEMPDRFDSDDDSIPF